MSLRRGPWACKYFLTDLCWFTSLVGRVPLTVTFQLEVAKRICAPIECDERTRISIVSQHISEPKLEFVIPGLFLKTSIDNPSRLGQCFVPNVKVSVGVVRFVPREQPLISTSFDVRRFPLFYKYRGLGRWKGLQACISLSTKDHYKTVDDSLPASHGERNGSWIT